MAGADENVFKHSWKTEPPFSEVAAAAALSNELWPRKQGEGLSNELWLRKQGEGLSNELWPRKQGEGLSNELWPRKQGEGGESASR